MLHIHLVLARYHVIDIYVCVIHIRADPEHINIICLQIVEHLLHLVRAQFYICKEIIDLLNFQHAFFLFPERYEFLHSFQKFLCVFFHVSILPSPARERGLSCFILSLINRNMQCPEVLQLSFFFHQAL